jgi:hypothetical protein
MMYEDFKFYASIYKDSHKCDSTHYANMAPKVKTEAAFLRSLYKAPAKKRKAAVANANKDQIKALCECALNVCERKFKPKPGQLKIIRPHEGTLLRLAYAREPLEVKKRLLIQSGGVLPVLATLGISALSSLIPKLFGV